MPTVFPSPDHNHAHCAADVIAHAEKLCAGNGQRLTPMRRKVLEVLAASHKPLGAYEIIDAVAKAGPRPAPITIYRALDKPLWMGAVWIVAVVCLVFSHIPEALIPPLAYGVGIGSVAAWLAPHLFKWNRLDL